MTHPGAGTSGPVESVQNALKLNACERCARDDGLLHDPSVPARIAALSFESIAMELHARV